MHGLDNDDQIFFYEQEFYIFSNFSSFKVRWKGHDWMTAEHAYHSEKFDDPEILEALRNSRSAHDAMKLAYANKDKYRNDWDVMRLGVMKQILHAKVEQHPYVKKKLLESGDKELIENSWRDDHWGWGLNRDGANHLGKLWMEVRAEIRSSNRESHIEVHPLCPDAIKNDLCQVRVRHFDFEGEERVGQLVVHKELETDARELFERLYEARFPIRSVTPIAEFGWDDLKSMAADNSSAFNYRTIAGKDKLSQHAFGRAIDINPLENPCIVDGVVSPAGAVYEPDKPGTITEEGPVVRFLEERGWEWGGRWNSLKDYQHFEKTA